MHTITDPITSRFKLKLLMVIKHTCNKGRGTNQRKFIVSDQSHTVNIKYMYILTINFLTKCRKIIILSIKTNIWAFHQVRIGSCWIKLNHFLIMWCICQSCYWIGWDTNIHVHPCNHFHYVDCSLRYFLPEIRIDFLHMTRNGKISIQLKRGWSTTSSVKSPQTSQVNYVELNQVYWAIKWHYTLHLI